MSSHAIFHKQLGDLVLLQPALASLADLHGAPVCLATRSGHAPLVELMSGVELAKLPAGKEAALYSFDALSKSAWRAFLTPAKRKFCMTFEPDKLRWYHRFIYGEIAAPELGDEYVARYYWKNLPYPPAGPFRAPVLNPPPPEWRPASLPAGEFILINPAAGWKRKRWEARAWADTIRAVREKSGLPCLMTGGSIDWQIEHCRKIEEKAAGAVTNLSSGTTLKEYLWLCANARLVLTVDGAASHLAAASGVRSVTLFGPTNMANWHLASPISVAIAGPRGDDGAANLKNLPADSVIDAAFRLLG